MRIQQQPAFVLHSAEYRESSLRLEVFTRDHGRLGLIARGARRPSSGLRGVLSAFQPLLISWSGRGELPTLTGAESDGAGAVLVGQALLCGFYINELLIRMLHRHDPHERLHTAYHDAVRELERAPHAPEGALRIFEKRLLQEAGYGLVLDHEVIHNSPIMPEAMYRYVPDRGPMPAEADGVDSIPIRGATLLALAREELRAGPELAEAKRLLRGVLARHLGGRPLRSRELFRQVVRDATEEVKEGR